ncbi:MAG: hypothetical protein P4N41_08020 [Negativicutes bacterium]|nr:hypothetical protein [Negativicutes bacterium]
MIILFFTAIFFCAVAGFIALIDKRRWRSTSVIGFIALDLALVAELIGQVYSMWDFIGNENWLFISLSNAAVYTLSACLFIQWYPFGNSKGRRFAYWLAWTTYAAALECLYLWAGHMVYLENWSFGLSYGADWFLFWIYYQTYRTLRLERLNG